MPIGVFHRSRHKFGLQICPLCLAEDKEPFYRKEWRLSWVTVCTRHNSLLLDRCPGCQAPIVFHRGDMGWRNQFVSFSNVRCSNCEVYWTSQRVINETIKADERIIVFQQKLSLALNNGWTFMRYRIFLSNVFIKIAVKLITDKCQKMSESYHIFTPNFDTTLKYYVCPVVYFDLNL